jgi:hypothetical protein
MRQLLYGLLLAVSLTVCTTGQLLDQWHAHSGLLSLAYRVRPNCRYSKTRQHRALLLA